MVADPRPDREGIRLTSRDWWFRDRQTGETVIAQFPNPALWLFLATVAVGAFLDGGSVAGRTVRWTGTGALAWWSLDEVVRGVNPWRRLLGMAGLGFVGARVVQLLGT
jgi:hypothetical protein